MDHGPILGSSWLTLDLQTAGSPFGVLGIVSGESFGPQFPSFVNVGAIIPLFENSVSFLSKCVKEITNGIRLSTYLIVSGKNKYGCIRVFENFFDTRVFTAVTGVGSSTKPNITNVHDKLGVARHVVDLSSQNALLTIIVRNVTQGIKYRLFCHLSWFWRWCWFLGWCSRRISSGRWGRRLRGLPGWR